MNLSGIFLMVFIFAIVYYISSMPSQRGGVDTELNLTPNQSIYTQQYNELHDVNNVLKREVQPADETTNNLVGYNLSDSTPTELQAPNKKGQRFYTHPVAKPITSELRHRVKERQPYFLRKPYIKTYYGKTYYPDARYPLFLVDTAFAEDPEKFLREHPMEYPSYVIASRTPQPQIPKGVSTLGPFASYEPK
jgi:hypothetical protein